jgi:hypothetical protein
MAFNGRWQVAEVADRVANEQHAIALLHNFCNFFGLRSLTISPAASVLLPVAASVSG